MGLTKQRWEERFPSRGEGSAVDGAHGELGEDKRGWMLGHLEEQEPGPSRSCRSY